MTLISFVKGVDLYCEQGTEVIACEDGIVVEIPWFTGSNVATEDGMVADWWNDTKAVMIEGVSGVIVYGEIDPSNLSVDVGQHITAGDTIGRVVVPVLKQFKGRPTVMLHFELMTHGSREALWWNDISQRPNGLIDPTPSLREAAPDAPVFDLNSYDGVAYINPAAPRKASRWWKVWGGAVDEEA
jgi:murein DD-endopeptidase MepM/ murein hydrolase activator NlpD